MKKISQLFSVFMALVLLFMPLNGMAFSDIEDSPYKEAILWAKYNKIVSGYSSGLFKPEQKVNHAEFIAMINRKFYSSDEIYDTDCFYDVQNQYQWFAKYFCTARRKELLGDRKYLRNIEPEKLVALDSALRIIRKVLGEKGEYLTDNYLKKKGIVQKSMTVGIDWLTRGRLIEILWKIETDEKSEVLPEGYEILNNELYFYGQKVEGVDTKSFKVLDTKNNFVGDKNSVWGLSLYGSIIKLPVDRDSFHVIEDAYIPYGKDKNNIYFNTNGDVAVLKNLNLETFRLVKVDTNIFATDGEKAFHIIRYEGITLREIPGLDVDSLMFIEFDGYKDKYSGYYSGYYKDKNQIYFFYHTFFKKLENVDFDSFEVLNNWYAKDKNHVFGSDLILEQADPKTFEAPS